MKETFENYLQRLKDRRTEDDYKYTDENFIQYQEYIRDCWLTNLSVYKCLEFMYFAEKETLEQIASKQFQKDFNDEVGKVLVQQLNKEIHLEDIFNDEKKEGIKKLIQEHKNGK